MARFRPTTLPHADELMAVIEENLPDNPSPVWQTRPASEVPTGDRVVVPGGIELTVSRIEPRFLGRDDLICLVKDTPARWFAQPIQKSVEVKVLG